MSSHKIEHGHQDAVHDAAIDYYGRRIATASSDCSIRIHSVGSASSPSSLLATLGGHAAPIWCASWAHPKFGSVLASCGYDGRVVIWKESSTSPNQWTQVQAFTEHKSSVNSISWAPHELGLSLACGSSDGSISVYTAQSDGSWETAKIERAHPVGVTAVSWAPAVTPGSFAGSFVCKIASGGFDSSVRIWEFVDGIWRSENPNLGPLHSDWVRDVEWAPALGLPRSTIASCSEEGKVVIWTKGKGGEGWKGIVMKEFNVPVWRVNWALTGNILSVADSEGNITLWKEVGPDGRWEQVTKVEHLSF